MKVRRARLLAALNPNEICPTVPCFPLLGVGTFTEPPHPPGGPTAQSLFVPDALINPHPRFPALTANIRERRGAKVDIRVPRFRDTNTPQGVVGAPPPATVEEALKMVISGGIVTPKDHRPREDWDTPQISAATYENLELLREGERTPVLVPKKD